MKHQQILLFCIVTLSSTGLCAMRLTNAFSRSGLQRNSGALLYALYSTKKCTALIVHPEVQKYQHLKNLTKTPNDLKLQEALEREPRETKQVLLATLIQDTQVNPKALVALLRAGASINIRDTKGQTPLHLLAQASNDNAQFPDETYLMCVLNYIADFSPDFTVRDAQEKTPADYAPDKFKLLFKHHDPIDSNKRRYMLPHI